MQARLAELEAEKAAATAVLEAREKLLSEEIAKTSALDSKIAVTWLKEGKTGLKRLEHLNKLKTIQNLPDGEEKTRLLRLAEIEFPQISGSTRGSRPSKGSTSLASRSRRTSPNSANTVTE